MKKIVAFFACWVAMMFVSPGVWAQQTSSQFPVKERPPERARPVDPKAMELASELVRTMDIRSLFSVFHAKNTHFEPYILRDNPKQDATTISEIVRDAVQKTFLSKLKQIEGYAVTLYAQRFSPDELREIVAFYKSPVGEKLLGETPKIMTDLTIEHPWNGVYGMEQGAQHNIAEMLRRAGMRIPKELRYR